MAVARNTNLPQLQSLKNFHRLRNTNLPKLQSLKNFHRLHFLIFSLEIFRIGAKLNCPLILLSRFFIRAPKKFWGQIPKIPGGFLEFGPKNFFRSQIKNCDCISGKFSFAPILKTSKEGIKKWSLWKIFSDCNWGKFVFLATAIFVVFKGFWE